MSIELVPKPYKTVKLNRHVGDFVFGTVWEVRQPEGSGNVDDVLPIGKYKRWGLKVQRGDRRAMEEGIRVWKRANGRGAMNVPTMYVPHVESIPG